MYLLIKDLWRTILVENNRKNIARAFILVAAGIFLLYGISRGEVAVVFSKAVNICLECIGLG